MHDNIGLASQPETRYMPFNDESPLEFLERKRRAFAEQESNLREQIASLQVKLNDLQKEREQVEAALVAIRNQAAHGRHPDMGPPLTIKEGVMEVLERITPKGLPAIAILERLKADFDMHYPRTSLSPQLSRLKAEGKISLRGNTWFLSDAKRPRS